MMKRTAKIVVIIPCYNCERQIPRVMEGFDLSLLAKIQKVIILDNRSTDGTVDTALLSAKKINNKKVMVCVNNENVSLGGSHKAGFLYGEMIGADYVAVLHGDNQALTKDLHLLIDEIYKYPKLDAVLGSRFMPGSSLIGYSWKRILGNRLLNIIYSLTLLRRINDLGSGLNIFKLKFLDSNEYIKFGDDLGFNFDLLLYLCTKKLKIKYVPITWTEEDQISNAKNFRVAKLAVLRLFKWRLGLEPVNSTRRTKDSYIFKENKYV